MAGKNYGIDFGTGNIKILCEASNKILNEKNIIAIKNKNENFSFGNEAYEMFEKAPYNIRTVFPVEYGVISDIKSLEALFDHLYLKINDKKKINGGIFYIAVPTDVTEVEKRAFYKLISNSQIKARKIFFVEKSIADSIGIGINTSETGGNLIVNIGAGTTEISVIAYGGIVSTKIIRVAGDHFDTMICEKVEKDLNISIGKKTAEILKCKLSDLKFENTKEMSIYGQSRVNGLPLEVKISSDIINNCLIGCIDEIIIQIKKTMEKTPPEILKDIYSNGIFLTGGSSNLKNLDTIIFEETGIKVNSSVEPSETTLRGLKNIINDNKLSKFKYLPKKVKNK